MSSVEPTLRTWLEARPRTLAERIQVFLAIAEALHRSHAETGARRYVSPANIRVDAAGEVTLIGETIAPPAPESRVDRPNRTLDDSSRDSNPRLVTADAIERGLELDYAPPELIVGLPYDARSEQFCFCVMLFEAVHGLLPFAARDLDGPTNQWTQPARFPRRSAAPPKLDELLLRGLAVPPSERWPSIEALIEALREVAETAELEPRVDRRVVVGVVLAALIAAGVLAAVYAQGA